MVDLHLRYGHLKPRLYESDGNFNREPSHSVGVIWALTVLAIDWRQHASGEPIGKDPQHETDEPNDFEPISRHAVPPLLLVLDVLASVSASVDALVGGLARLPLRNSD